MPIVYVVQEPMKKQRGKVVSSMNLTTAEVYGELRCLLEWRDMQTLAIQPTIWKLRKGLSNFTDEDYLLAVGHPMAIGLATAIACTVNRGRIQMLYWDKDNRGYVSVRGDIYRGGTRRWKDA